MSIDTSIEFYAAIAQAVTERRLDKIEAGTYELVVNHSRGSWLTDDEVTIVYHVYQRGTYVKDFELKVKVDLTLML